MDVRVANTGGRAGDLVVPVYVGQPVTRGVLAPPKRLVAFTRVGLAPGESRTVHLTVPVSLLAVTPGDIDGAGTPRVAPGDYVFSAGDSTSTVTLR